MIPSIRRVSCWPQRCGLALLGPWWAGHVPSRPCCAGPECVRAGLGTEAERQGP